MDAGMVLRRITFRLAPMMGTTVQPSSWPRHQRAGDWVRAIR